MTTCPNNVWNHTDGCTCVANGSVLTETDVDLLTATEVGPHPNTVDRVLAEGEPVAWVHPETREVVGGRVILDAADVASGRDIVSINRPVLGTLDRVDVLRSELLVDKGPIGGGPVAVSSLEEGDYVIHDGRISEVTYIDVDGDTVTVELDGDDHVEFDAAADVESADSSDRYMTREESLARNPDWVPETMFREDYRPVHNPKTNSEIFEFPEDLEGVDENRVWTQVQGTSDDGREVFTLSPGFSRVDAMNYVVTERPWTDDMMVVDWN